MGPQPPAPRSLAVPGPGKDTPARWPLSKEGRMRRQRPVGEEQTEGAPGGAGDAPGRVYLPHTHFSLSRGPRRWRTQMVILSLPPTHSLRVSRSPGSSLLPPPCSYAPTLPTGQGPVSSLASELRSRPQAAWAASPKLCSGPAGLPGTRLISQHPGCQRRGPSMSGEGTEAPKGGRTCLRCHMRSSRWSRPCTALCTRCHLPGEGPTPSPLTVAILDPLPCLSSTPGLCFGL